MQKLVFLLLCLVVFSVEATNFKSSMSVTPCGVNEYLVNIQLSKILNEGSTELVASPSLVCVPNELSRLTTGDQTEGLFVEVMIADTSSEKTVYASVLLKEQGESIFSFDNAIMLRCGHSPPPFLWK